MKPNNRLQSCLGPTSGEYVPPQGAATPFIAKLRKGRAAPQFLEDAFVEDNVEDSARKLAQDCARDQGEAVYKVVQILARRGAKLGYFDNKARNNKAEEFAQAYLRVKRMRSILSTSISKSPA